MGKKQLLSGICRMIWLALKSCLFVGFSVQIVLGIWWMICNFTTLQLFGDTALLVEMSDGLILKNNTGVLYPALLVLVRSITAFSSKLWFMGMYLLQLLLALAAGWFFCKKLGMGIFSLWGSLVLMTFPMAMQCHLAVLPDSLVGSFLLLQFGFFIGGLWKVMDVRRVVGVSLLVDETQGEKKEAKLLRSEELAGVCLFWLLLGLLKKEYIFFGGILVVILFLCQVILWPGRSTAVSIPRKALFLLKGGVTILLVALLMVQITKAYSPISTSSDTKVMEVKSKEEILFERLAWGTILNNQSRWPQELTELIDYDTLYKTSLYTDNVPLLLEPALEEQLGEVEAQALYELLNQRILQEHKREAILEIGMDGLGYLMPPVFLERYLNGSGYGSYNLRNYDVMKQKTPVLTRNYVDYGNLWFVGSLCLSLICGVISGILGVLNMVMNRGHRKLPSDSCQETDEIKGCSKGVKSAALLPALLSLLAWLFLIGLLAVFYVFRGSAMQDYKLVLIACYGWLCLNLRVFCD